MHSIAAQKEEFIREQVKILSRRIQPERTTWETEGEEGEEEIPEKVIEEAVKKAKQIASLYMREIREGENKEEEEKDDLSMMPLPEEIEVDEKTREEYATHPIIILYSSLYSNLQSLSAELKEEQARLGRYKQLETLLKPFERPGETVQQNLEMRG
ncbi:hypothetical protein KEM55_006780, partial [Ascosphaera atra]